ncbi:leucine-rich repeat domain-containing protein [Candidatus Bipolaricaulota bacterium]|nr:leucine-rich repeat domain-containing protein [Candidatus Bipolaricaulota bacterium]
MNRDTRQFEDPALELAVRAALSKPRDDLLDDDLQRLQSLHATNCGLVSLRGIEQCVNLRSLSLNGNRISDLEPTSGLQRLEILQLQHNRLDSVTPLAGLSRLV